MSVKALKGFKDILPEETVVWRKIESLARSIFSRYGFSEIRVPVLEKTGLFVRSIGEATDIVEKEMYTFEDRNGSSVTMRPEGTAPVLRAFIEHSMQVQKPVQRLYTMGPMFRHERPQKGRLRQFHQISVEVLGADQPVVDAELMSMAWQLTTSLGLDVSLEINSLGCPECRPAYNKALLDFLESRADSLCDDCQRRREKNPLRVLDCKNQSCQEQYQGVPELPDHLCGECESHFDSVKKLLSSLDIPFKVNAFMVRGLDYYTRTTFELITGDLGAQSAVGAGGRYDSLIGQLGGPKKMPGIGFAVGMERLVLLLLQKGEYISESGPDLFVVALGEEASAEAFKIIHFCRMAGLDAILDPAGRSLKNQMKQAGKANARYAFILGEDELANGVGVLRNMGDGEQQEVELGSDLKNLSRTLAEIISA